MLANLTTWIFAYWPAALGVSIGKALQLSAVGVDMAGCLFNLVSYAMLASLAVKCASRYKLTFLTIACLPTNIIMAASYSYDPMLIGTVLLAMSLWVTEMCSKTAVRPARLFAMTALLCLGTIVKPAYAPLLFLLMLLPAARMGGKKPAMVYRVYVLVLLVLCVGSMLIPGNYDGMANGDYRFEDADAAGQIAFIKENPWAFVKNMVDYFGNGNWYKLFIAPACSFAFAGESGALCLVLFAILLLIAPLSHEEKKLDLSHPLTWQKRLFLWVMTYLPLMILVITQYIVSTKPGADSVAGMQPRYTLPVYITMALMVMLPKSFRKIPAWLSRTIATCTVLLMAGVILWMSWSCFVAQTVV